jgi:lipopolysaccharide transport system ATP-binding protein
MSKTVISVENLTKRYDLGVIGTGTISRDLNRWWAHLRQQPDPYTKIGQEDKLKRRGESILALDDISFTVQQGEALGIIGKNGAGKSTLLKILSRVTAPTSGVVKIKGRIGSLLEVGTGFHPELTGRENVFLNGAILGMWKEEVQRKFDEIVDFSGVEKFIDTPVKRYSSGMYVRLAFAVAAHLDPEILVVDEVLAVGDAEFQKKCLGKMGDVAGEGRTVLFVSHNMAAIENLCARSFLLISGSVNKIGNTDMVVSSYLSMMNHDNRSYKKEFKKPNNRDSWLEKISILINDSPSSIMKYGDELKIELTFNSASGLIKPSIGIVISSIRGEAIINTNNQYLPSPKYHKPINSGIICCNFGKIPLMEGRYTASIWFGESANAQHDYFENIIIFDVVAREIWGQAKLPTRNISNMWWPTDYLFSTHEPGQ